MKRWTLREQFRQSSLIEAVIAFCLLLQVSTLGHFVFVQHETCVEHGELVHVGEFQQPMHVASMGTKVSATQVSVTPGEAPDAKGHDHCPLVPDRAEHALFVPVSSRGGLNPGVPSIQAPHAVGAILSSETLCLLAPKTSPPV